MSDAYNAGLLNDWGGGNVDWWQDYIRAELGWAHDFYADLSAAKDARIAELERQLAEAREVKPLEWIKRSDIEGLHNAKSPIGWWYNVRAIDGGRFAYEGDPVRGLLNIPKAYPTLEAAKAAAQADYTASVLSALKETP
jgi:hypothetical protein